MNFQAKNYFDGGGGSGGGWVVLALANPLNMLAAAAADGSC
jgi:hypothetical protein